MPMIWKELEQCIGHPIIASAEYKRDILRLLEEDYKEGDLKERLIQSHHELNKKEYHAVN